jgi:DNA-binding transcriptional MocR family regulator
MTSWLPDLTGLSGPLYQRLAERIERDIGEGVLAEGAKLPPQRDLAYDIGTTVGTVGRAYSLLRERGLVSGEVGRGTYILARKPTLSIAPRDVSLFHKTQPGTVRFDIAATPDVGQAAVLSDHLAAICRDYPQQVSGYAGLPDDRWLEAGSVWLTRDGFAPTSDMIVPATGFHSAIMAVVSACTKPGDLVLFEELTWPLAARATREIGRRVDVVEIDEQGVIPERFRAACAQKHPKLAIFTPTANCPTCITMPEERRAELAEIAREFNVLLIEDDQFGKSSLDPTPLLVSFAPERTFVVGGLGTSAVRGGAWVACPPAFRNRVRIGFKLLTGGMPFLVAESTARLVLSGDASRMQDRVTERTRAVMRQAETAFAPHAYNSSPNLPFLWLALPSPWNSSTFKQAALQNGLVIDDEDEFKVARSDAVFHRVWIGLGGNFSGNQLASGLAVLRQLLDDGPAGYERFS